MVVDGSRLHGPDMTDSTVIAEYESEELVIGNARAAADKALFETHAFRARRELYAGSPVPGRGFENSTRARP